MRESEEQRQRRATANAARAAKVERPYSTSGLSHPGRRPAGPTAPPTTEDRAKATVRKERSKEAVLRHEEDLQLKENLRMEQNAARREALRKDWELLHAP